VNPGACTRLVPARRQPPLMSEAPGWFPPWPSRASLQGRSDRHVGGLVGWGQRAGHKGFPVGAATTVAVVVAVLLGSSTLVAVMV